MEIPLVGTLFFLKKRERTELGEYIPMTKEVHDDLKSFEPGKFTLDYEDYIRLVDKPNYERLKDNNEISTKEVSSFFYNIKESKDKVRKRISEVETSNDFISWLASENVMNFFKEDE